MSILGGNLALQRRGGIAAVEIDGVVYDLVGDLAYSAVKITREMMIGQDAIHGYSEKPKACYMSMTIRDANGMSTASFNAKVNSTVTAVLANGKVVSGGSLVCTEQEEVNTAEGSFKLKFEGRLITETSVI